MTAWSSFGRGHVCWVEDYYTRTDLNPNRWNSSTADRNMRFNCNLKQREDGSWSARHQSKDVGELEVRASSRDDVIEKMKNEIRYRLELCPCTGETYQHVAIEIIES